MKGWLIWSVVGIALIGLVAWRFSAKGAAEGALKQQAGQRRGGGSTVEVATVTNGSIFETLETVGSVESPYRVLISPKLSGRIEYLEAREGDHVKPGQVLVKLDGTEVQGQVLQQQANLAETRSRLAQAKLNQTPTTVGVTTQIAQQEANLASAKADDEQVRRNYDAQVASANSQVTDQEARVDAATSQVANAEASVELQKANMANAQAKFDRAKQQIEKGYISAQAFDDVRTALDVQKGALKVAEGQRASAKSALRSANAQLASARDQAGIVVLKGKADIAASAAKVKQARAALNLAQANRAITPAYEQNIAALKADVEAAQGQLRQAQARLSDTTLTSPIEGTVTARKADVGTLATPNQPVLEVQFIDWLFVTAPLPVEESSRVKEGLSASVRFDSLPDRTFRGTVSNVNYAADPQTRQFSIRIRLDNKDHAIRPGMYVRVSVETGKTAEGPLVPREAVKSSPAGSTVTVVDDESVAHVRSVKVGASDAARVQILEGVQAGEKVVVLAYNPVQDGKKVTVGGAKGRVGEGEKGPGEGKKGKAGEGEKGRGSTDPGSRTTDHASPPTDPGSPTPSPGAQPPRRSGGTP